MSTPSSCPWSTEQFHMSMTMGYYFHLTHIYVYTQTQEHITFRLFSQINVKKAKTCCAF